MTAEAPHRLWITRRCAVNDLHIADRDWPPHQFTWPRHDGVDKFRHVAVERAEGGIVLGGLPRLTYLLRRSTEAGATWLDRRHNVVFLLAWTKESDLRSYAERQGPDLYPTERDYDDRLLFVAEGVLDDVRDRIGPELFAQAAGDTAHAAERAVMREDTLVCTLRLEAQRVGGGMYYVLQIDARDCPALQFDANQLLADKLTEHLHISDRFGIGSSLYGISDPDYHVFYLFVTDR